MAKLAFAAKARFPFEPPSVPDCMCFGIIVEIDEKMPPASNLLLHPTPPTAQRRFGVAALILLFRTVKADVCNRPHRPPGHVKPRQIMRAERNASLIQ